MKRGDGAPRPAVGGFDKVYFDSYAHLSIHEEMIKDRVRTDTYRRAILNNASDFKGKVVLDVGAGTGILSFFCLQAGAAKVYAVEASDLADLVREVVVQNKAADRIIVIKAKVEEVQLPEAVDIVLSEWMGYALLYESMFDSVVWARKNLGTKACRMFPAKATVQLALLSDEEIFAEKVLFWKSVYGVDMSALIPYAKKCAFEEPLVETVSAEQVMSFATTVLNLDCNTTDPIETFEADFKLYSMISAPMHGFVMWFDVSFVGSVSAPVVLSTAPEREPTHWKQTLFFLDEPLRLEQDDLVAGRIAFRKNANNSRCVDHTISFAVNNGPVTSKTFQMK